MSDWWRSAPEILGSDYERVYRLDPEAARREVDSILAMSGIAPGASVLDLCCGVGRHAVEFARRGFAVTGLDISPTFLHVARAFRRGGRFVLDFFNHDWIIRHFQPFAWWEANGLHCMERRRFDIHTGRHESHLVIIDESGKRRDVQISVRGYTFVEIAAMLERVGLQVLDSFGGYDRRPFGLETPQLIILAGKPA